MKQQQNKELKKLAKIIRKKGWFCIVQDGNKTIIIPGESELPLPKGWGEKLMISLRAREIFKVNGEAFTEEELNDIFGK